MIEGSAPVLRWLSGPPVFASSHTRGKYQTGHLDTCCLHCTSDQCNKKRRHPHVLLAFRHQQSVEETHCATQEAERTPSGTQSLLALTTLLGLRLLLPSASFVFSHLRLTIPHAMEQRQVSESGHHSPTAQRSQCQLVHVLLLWIAILTVSQGMFLTFFFSTGTQCLHCKRSDDTGKTTDTTNSSGTSHRVQQQRVYGMLTCKVKATDNSNMKTKIHWEPWNTNSLVKSEANVLTIQQDGSYFLYLQVTLGQQRDAAKEYMVQLQRLETDEILLEGRLTNSTITMFQGKSEILSRDDTLVVTVYPEADINTTRTATYLGIIYQPKIILPSNL